MTDWYAVSVTVAPEASEAIEYAFNSLDALGTEIDHLHKKNLDTVTIVGYFNELPDEDRVQDELQYALRIYGLDPETVTSLERSAIERTDWLAEWKKHWRPTTIGRFVIAPPWSDVENGDKIVVRIEPNMAFGTGTHETTQLCLRAIDEHYSPGETFLDVGTGTGILAIAAAKLNGGGQPAIVGYDTDVDSIKIARENAELNRVENSITFHTGTISDETPPCDFVCANLTLDVIQPLFSRLLNMTGRLLVLSGILVEQEQIILKLLESSDVRDVEVNRSGEWISVTVRKTRDKRRET